MNTQSVFNVDDNKVIVTGLRSRICCRAEFGWCLGETCNRSDVCLLFGRGYVAPVIDVNMAMMNTEMESTYHSRRTCSLSLVHVVDLATTASTAGRPLAARSDTASAAQRTESNDKEASRAYTALNESRPAIIQIERLDC
jgi:hypothetical protein